MTASTVKNDLHQLVDSLDDERLGEARALLQGLLLTRNADVSVAAAQEKNELALASPFTFNDPLWGIVGIIKDGPADLSERHDHYLADAHGDSHER